MTTHPIVAIGSAVVLPDGRRVTVRPMVATDAGLLGRLYGQLSDEDRYRRFFTGGRPTDRTVEAWAASNECGGFALVATVDEKDGERVVGEAGYQLLPNGDGELAITVDPEWRGGLGSYLLDRLLTAAAERSVPNLEAEILTENRRMLSLIRRRAYALVPHDDWSSVHMLLAADGGTPHWPPRRRGPRVLVESRGGWLPAPAARAAGLDVICCPGPDPARGTTCPVLDGRSCPLGEGADAIVVNLPGDDPATAQICAAHPTLHPHALAWVQHPDGRIETPDGSFTASRSPLGGDLIDRLVDALPRAGAREAAGDAPIVPS